MTTAIHRHQCRAFAREYWKAIYKTRISMKTEADFTPTGKFITHRGTRFEIHDVKHPDAESPYGLKSARGPMYILLRNVTRPGHLFGVSFEGSKCLPGWFTDEDGELKSLNP